MESAQRSKTRHEEYLIERIPKLTTYDGFTATRPEHQTPLVPQNDQEPQTSVPPKLQKTLENYISIGEITRNKRERKKRREKKR